jgi:hypothetical protein
MATNSTSPLQSLLSGEMIPLIPDARLLAQDNGLELFHYLEKLNDYIRRLLGALTSVNIFNEIITNPPPNLPPGLTTTHVTDWRYDSTTQKFQKKTRSVTVLAVGEESDWTNTTDGQPSGVTNLTDFQYDATSHKFQYKTQSSYVLPPVGSVSAFTNAGGSQPVASTSITSWQYNTSTHHFEQKTRQAYVLELASESSFGDTAGTQPSTVARVIRNVDYSTSTHELTEDGVVDVYVLEKGADFNGTNVDTAELGDCA